jgi:potassium-transporting ATPase ATP-binding subunit
MLTTLFRAMDSATLRAAVWDACIRLHPKTQLRNPVMFVVWVGSVLTTIIAITEFGRGAAFTGWIAAWLWFTVWFANLAESLAESRGRAQAAALKGIRKQVIAKRLIGPTREAGLDPVDATQLAVGDTVYVEAGDTIPGDGEVIEGVATVDEAAITGESAPVIRESGGDFASVTGGTRILSDWLVIRITARAGDAFLDRMIAMVEGAKRGRTPNEVALSILLTVLTAVFLIVCITLWPFSAFSVGAADGQGEVVSVTILVALLVCLIPTTIGGLLPAIGISGMGRMMKANVMATSGRAVEAAGDIDVLLLDKTGTITFGNRGATTFHAIPGVRMETLAEVATLASIADTTPEGRSVLTLAKDRLGITGVVPARATVIEFTAQTRMSGIDLPNGSFIRQIRKGAVSAVAEWVTQQGGSVPPSLKGMADEIGRRGGTPLAVADGKGILGIVELKDIVKAGLKERFADLRAMGIKTVMVTGDNRMTAAAIAAEAGVDDYVAEAKPEDKLRLIREHQARGQLVAMTGDGTNDAPALAQADVAVAMNTGTQAAKEAGNMVDLDSDPTKLIEIVRIGKQMLMTRGALTTFSIANDVAKYFAIIPAAFSTTYPALATLDIMHLTNSQSAILAAVIFNALIIVVLIPLALQGVTYRAMPAAPLLTRNLLTYGLGGLIAPFVGIKVIDMALAALGWA